MLRPTVLTPVAICRRYVGACSWESLNLGMYCMDKAKLLSCFYVLQIHRKGKHFSLFSSYRPGIRDYLNSTLKNNVVYAKFFNT
jgi:hypothetical protein